MHTFSNRRTWIAAAGTALALLALAAGVATPARAGTYEVWSCRAPDGGPAPTDGWSLRSRDADAHQVVLSDSCATRGALDVALADTTSFVDGARASATLAAPAGTTIVGYTLWRSLRAAASLLPPITYSYAAAVREQSATADVDDGCASYIALPTWACSSPGSPTDAGAPGNRVDRRGVQLDGIELWAGCISVLGCTPAFTPPPAQVRLYGARVELEDLSAPTAPQLSGSLVGGAPVTGTATLVVESADAGGGIAATTLSIDGDAPRRSAPGGTCRTPYTTPQPCPTAAARAFTVDTSGLAQGLHTASGTVVDAAGNVTAYGPVAFTVEHPRTAPPPDGGGSRPPDERPPGQREPAPIDLAPDRDEPTGNGTPAVRRPLLRLDRTRVTSSARGARLTGTLRTRDGVPIVGARLSVRVLHLGDVDGRPRRIAPVTTSRRGTFSIAVRDDAPVRVEVFFAPAEDAADTASAHATVQPRAALSLARSDDRIRRGQAVTLRGELSGAGGAARGALVEIQAIVRGRWRAVGTVDADRRGRYRWRYRFVGVTRDTIFTFRAVVHRTPGWPLPTQVSRRVLVRVDAAGGSR